MKMLIAFHGLAATLLALGACARSDPRASFQVTAVDLHLWTRVDGEGPAGARLPELRFGLAPSPGTSAAELLRDLKEHNAFARCGDLGVWAYKAAITASQDDDMALSVRPVLRGADRQPGQPACRELLDALRSGAVLEFALGTEEVANGVTWVSTAAVQSELVRLLESLRPDFR